MLLQIITKVTSSNVLLLLLPRLFTSKTQQFLLVGTQKYFLSPGVGYSSYATDYFSNHSKVYVLPKLDTTMKRNAGFVLHLSL